MSATNNLDAVRSRRARSEGNMSAAAESEEDALAQMIALASAYREEVARSQAEAIELEIRIGVWESAEEHFCPGTSREVFLALENDMSDVPSLTLRSRGVGEWEELTDYHYTGADGVPIRTRVVYDSSNMSVETEHVVKQTLSSFVLVKSTESTNMECVRIALSKETRLLCPPETCLPTHVRVKQRKTFEDRRRGRCVWAYDLSRTWSGNSRSCIEKRQHDLAPKYEVECELVDEDRVYSSALSDSEMATSIFAKVRDILGCDENERLLAYGVRGVTRQTSRNRARPKRRDAGSRGKRQRRPRRVS